MVAGGNAVRILVACEFSGIVRDAFTDRGHDVESCDLGATERPGKHYRGDVRDILEESWDMMLAFVPCTYLTKAHGAYRFPQVYNAAKFFMWLYTADIPKIAIENPPGYINSHVIKPTQVIQPYQFGEMYSKQTCLWLLNLPKLIPTKYNYRGASWTDCVRDPKERSRTFPGIAKAMAEQWG
jgi:hypothetical protein